MQTTTNSPVAVDTRTAAEMLGVSKSHLDKLRIEDPENSPPYFKVGRCIRYSIENLREWAAVGVSEKAR